MRKLIPANDPRLKALALPVEPGDDLGYLDDLMAICQKEKGVGLAASQIGMVKRAVYIFPDRKSGFFMLNPVITFYSPEGETKLEGCLSFPGIAASVTRAISIRVSYVTVTNDFNWGFQTEGSYSGLTARIIQHEVDHTNGICRVGDSRLKFRHKGNDRGRL